jgi:hypothetical protein
MGAPEVAAWPMIRSARSTIGHRAVNKIESLTRAELDAIIANALAEYDADVRAEWERIRIEPEKWRCSPWADATDGFWAVAIDNGRVLWLNDIEEGFNWSLFRDRGTIDEYLCNQTELVTIFERIAQQNNKRARARLREGGVPTELEGSGTIEVRQTTYWELRSRAGARYRIHFRDKAEVAFAGPEYSSIAIHDRHPLLVQYDSPNRTLYFHGTPVRPRSVAEDVERAIRADSASWRGLHEYAGRIEAVEHLLRASHGKLMDAPEPVCDVAARVLESQGVECSILGHAPARPGMRVLLLDRSYCIAAGFALEDRSDPK